ncbi:hypothetical protein DQ04_01571090 [Trypanosoma grayi]|uniref:hypothetical protein n=1 Tax=Trypanosoma grayi TaxID=71804 RepID=UPI0004F4095E|nr:hypothetical protein DQ04_01571090 [Trypanosoma grayi]KEG12626.1 hypothetical protein DQ04_01571090 [Trypanosoma grayi]
MGVFYCTYHALWSNSSLRCYPAPHCGSYFDLLIVAFHSCMICLVVCTPFLMHSLVTVIGASHSLQCRKHCLSSSYSLSALYVCVLACLDSGSGLLRNRDNATHREA